MCGRGNVVNGSMRVADVAGAIDFLNAQPFVRKGEIGLIGHSHGGWTAVRAAQRTYNLAARGLRRPSPTIRPVRRSSIATSPCRS